MLCIKMTKIAEMTFPCGQCMACRINKRRDWVSRMMLEAAGSGPSFFITLTYRIAQIVEDGSLTLDKKHVQDWFKRLRKLYPARAVRYFLVGEYGEKTQRPHYHAILFFSKECKNVDFSIEQNLLKSWTIGNIHLGDVTPESIQYCFGYVLKRLNKREIEKNGDLRKPEFAIYSRGLGGNAMPELLGAVHPDADGVLVIPSEYRVMGKMHPLPRYLKKKFKEKGYKIRPTSREALDEKMQTLQKDIEDLPRNERFRIWSETIQLHRKEQKKLEENIEKRRQRSKGRLLNNFVKVKKNETL